MSRVHFTVIGMKRVGILLVVGVLATALAAPAASSAAPVAAAAKKCKHKHGGKKRHKKCKKKGGSKPPNTPTTNSSALSISPSSFNFGSFPIGLTTSPQQFTVTNTAAGATGPLSTSITGANPGNYSKSGDTCAGFPLDGGSSCYLYVACVGSGSVPATFNANLDVSASPGGSREAALTCQQF